MCYYGVRKWVLFFYCVGIKFILFMKISFYGIVNSNCFFKFIVKSYLCWSLNGKYLVNVGRYFVWWI